MRWVRGKGKELAARWASLWTGGKRLGASLSQRIDYILRDASCLNYLRIPSMPRLTRLRGAYKSNEIAVKGEAMYREGLVKDWVKPRGASGPKQTHGGG